MKKLLPYILILAVVVGLFGHVSTVEAETFGTCRIADTLRVDGTVAIKAHTLQNSTQGNCSSSKGQFNPYPDGLQLPGIGIDQCAPTDSECMNSGVGSLATTPPTTTPPGSDNFDQTVGKQTCFTFTVGFSLNVPACILQLVYYAFYTIGGFILAVSAYFFDILIQITLSGDLLRQPFVSTGWVVVRDLSNMFFILILLYIAIQMILDIGGHGMKKMIAQVIIMALLINFSMFFTEVVIDTSNVLALVFYNKLSVDREDPITHIVSHLPLVNGKIDIAGGLTSAFNPTTNLHTSDFVAASSIQVQTSKGTVDSTGVSVSMLIGVTLVAGAIMIIAAYALLVAGFSFLGRLVELFVLIIFSPFAFMSFTLPELSGLEYIGWKGWFHRLLTVAFMAPIFMFFLFFIFLLIQGNLFSAIKATTGSDNLGVGILLKLLGLIIPAAITVILLLKATEFAKKGSGKFGEFGDKAAKMLGGLAIGAATGGTALLATGTIGRYANNVANDDELKKKAAEGNKGAQRKLARANYVASKSFDFRQSGIGKYAAKKSGVNFYNLPGLGTDKFKEGRKGVEKSEAKKQDEKRKTYMLSASAAETQDARAKAWEERYNSYRENAKRFRGDDFNEESFKKSYTRGENLSHYGFNEDEKGIAEIKNAKKINEDRQKAYAASLDTRTLDGDSAKKQATKAVRRFWDDYKEGVGKTMSSGRGLAAMGVAGALTGGVGAAVTPLVGGFVHAVMEAIEKGTNRSTNANLVATIRKGVPNTVAEALHHLNEAAGIKHEDHGDDHKDDHGNAGAHAPTATPAAGPAHPPAGAHPHA